MSVVLECRKLSKHYGEGGLAEPVLAEVSLMMRHGEAGVLIGPSGSGKTTLLSILGCLLTPSGGELHIASARVDFTSPRNLGELRRTRLGCFQGSAAVKDWTLGVETIMPPFGSAIPTSMGKATRPP